LAKIYPFLIFQEVSAKSLRRKNFGPDDIFIGFVKGGYKEGFQISTGCKSGKNGGVRRAYGCAATTKLQRKAPGLFSKPSVLSLTKIKFVLKNK
jgi:hypothetical protein